MPAEKHLLFEGNKTPYADVCSKIFSRCFAWIIVVMVAASQPIRDIVLISKRVFFEAHTWRKELCERERIILVSFCEG